MQVIRELGVTTAREIQEGLLDGVNSTATSWSSTYSSARPS